MRANAFLEVLNGLKPLAYGFNHDLEAQTIIAIDNQNSVKMVDLFSSKNIKSASEHNLFKNKKIVNVTSQMFDDENTILITTSSGSNRYSNFFFKSNLEQSSIMFESDSTPIIIANPDSLEPLIVYSLGGALFYGFIEEHKFKNVKFEGLNENVPKGIHTSSFIDVTGNMHSELLLHTKDKDKNYISIYQVDESLKLTRIESVELPSKIGPVLFSEFYSRISSDMIYISQEGTDFYINIHKNISIESEVNYASVDIEKFGKKKVEKVGTVFALPMKQKISEILGTEDYIPILENEDKSPSGIFLVDLLGRGIKDIFLTLKNTKNNTYKVVALSFDSSTPKFIMNDKCNLDSNISYEYIHSVSVCDYNNSGTLNLMITARDNSNYPGQDYITVPYEFDGADQETGITFLTLVSSSKKRRFYVPGSVVTMLYENEEKLCKTSLSPQTSFLSMQPYKVFVGLGATNLFINWAIIKVPSYNNDINRKDAVSFLVPNTFAVFTLQNKNWRVQSFFSKLFFNITVYSLGAIVVIFMTIFIILSIQEKRKYKMVMSKDSTRMIFNAL